MSRILRFLFPTTRYTARASLFLLALRVLFGVLLLSHGIAKSTISPRCPKSSPTRWGWAAGFR